MLTPHGQMWAKTFLVPLLVGGGGGGSAAKNCQFVTALVTGCKVLSLANHAEQEGHENRRAKFSSAFGRCFEDTMEECTALCGELHEKPRRSFQARLKVQSSKILAHDPYGFVYFSGYALRHLNQVYDHDRRVSLGDVYNQS